MNQEKKKEKDKDKDKEKNMKLFSCTFGDEDLVKNIEIESSKCKTLESLHNEIANIIGTGKDQFNFIDPPSNKMLVSMKKFVIDLKFINKSKNVYFLFPNNEKILIKDCANMELTDLLASFNKEGYYFSNACMLNNLHFSLFGIELPLDDNYFSNVPKNTSVQIKLKGKIVCLKYRNLNFYLSDNETVKAALNLLRKAFKGSKILSIQNTLNDDLDLDTKLRSKSSNNYKIRATKQFIFVSDEYEKSHNLEYLETVEEAKQHLSHIIGEDLTLNDILILDNKKKEVTEPEKTLISIMDNDNKIFFKIRNNTPKNHAKDLPKRSKSNPPSRLHPQLKMIEPDKVLIEFIFEANPEFNFDKEYPVNEKIKTIKDNIADIYAIDGKISVKFKIDDTYSFIKDNETIEKYEGLIKIKGKDKKYHYFLYIETDQDRIVEDKKKIKKKSPKKSIKHSTSPVKKEDKAKPTTKKEASEDNSEDLDKKADKPKIKETEKPDKPKRSKADEDFSEDETSHNKKKTKGSKVAKKKEEDLKKDDDDDDDDDTKERKKSKNLEEEEIEPKKAKKISRGKKIKDETKSLYRFRFDASIKKIELKDNSSLADNEDLIKEKFDIDDEDQLDYFIYNDDEDEPIKDPVNEKMKNFKNLTIRIEITEDENAGDLITKTIRTTMTGLKLITYFYQINGEDDIQKAEFNADAKIIDFKEFIKKTEKLQSLGDIKILFAGKDLLDDIVLKSLNIGTNPLYVYIRSTDDVYLYSARALHLLKNKSTE